MTSEECAHDYSTMNSRELIDAQFDRAVEIVQNLPKTGPIQTGYEEKLAMYRYVSSSIILSLYSQLQCASAFINKVSPPPLADPQIPHPLILVLATAGNVTSPRPGIWDMLGRAKWCLCSPIRRLLGLTSSQGRMGKA
jgi:hypothetical protein